MTAPILLAVYQPSCPSIQYFSAVYYNITRAHSLTASPNGFHSAISLATLTISSLSSLAGVLGILILLASATFSLWNRLMSRSPEQHFTAFTKPPLIWCEALLFYTLDCLFTRYSFLLDISCWFFMLGFNDYGLNFCWLTRFALQMHATFHALARLYQIPVLAQLSPPRSCPRDADSNFYLYRE